MATKVVACHQPNFLPWLGYFAKMSRCDVFCLLDDVQFTQGHGKHNWTSRVRILSPNGAIWLTVPVRRAGQGPQLVSGVKTVENKAHWLPKLLKTVSTAYGKTPHFAEVFPPLAEILSAHDGSLCATNIALIERIQAMLRLPARVRKSSELAVEGSGNRRLVNIVRAHGGAVYLSGDGADQYQAAAEFEAAGIRLERMGFHHPEYPQRHAREFVPGLSIIDALCNVGLAATREMLSSPQRAATALS